MRISLGIMPPPKISPLGDLNRGNSRSTPVVKSPLVGEINTGKSTAIHRLAVIIAEWMWVYIYQVTVPEKTFLISHND